jgi:hypothetical protein
MDETRFSKYQPGEPAIFQFYHERTIGCCTGDRSLELSVDVIAGSCGSAHWLQAIVLYLKSSEHAPATTALVKKMVTGKF